MKPSAPAGKPQTQGKADKRRHTVLGMRMTNERATDVKVEAAKRGMSGECPGEC